MVERYRPGDPIPEPNVTLAYFLLVLFGIVVGAMIMAAIRG